MKNTCLSFLFLLILLSTTATLGQDSVDDWWAWRGPHGNGITTNQQPPVSWSESENVLWSAEVTGRGHASPTVVGNQVILATADADSQQQFVASYDFETGDKLWETLVFEGNFNPKIYPTNTHASSTVASDGKHLIAVFNNDKAAQVVTLDLQGKVVWKKNAAPFIPKIYQFGFGSSPIVYKDTVIVSSECEEQGAIVAFRIEDGTEQWRIDRPRATSYSTPVVATVAGREQMLMSGGSMVESFDPATGALLWSADAPWLVSCGTPVWDDERVYVSGGYPAARTMAINADGSGELVWENINNCYEQSMLIHEGYLYGTTESGFAFCIRATDGEEMWKQRMDKKISASPVLADGNLYVSAENGLTYVFKATPDGYEEVSQNQLGNTAYATPTFVRNRILARIANGSGKQKQESLYCIGSK